MLYDKNLLICLLASFCVVLKMITGNYVFLIGFMLFVIYGMLSAKIEEKVLYLLYFISWVYVIKFDLSQMSLYLVLSSIYCFIALVYVIKNRISILANSLISVILFVSYAILTVIFSNNDNLLSLLGFFIKFLALFIALHFIDTQTLYPKYIHFHCMGLIVSGVVGTLRFINTDIDSFLMEMTRLNTVLSDANIFYRFAGLDLDPNYFSLQVLFVISCFFTIEVIDKKNSFLNVLAIISLSVLGIASLSKMFILVYSILLFIYLCIAYKVNPKFFIAFALGIPIFFIILHWIYSDYLMDIFVSRFLGNNNILDIGTLSTGRFEVISQYVLYLTNNELVLLFGAGVGRVFLNSSAPHNMYILCIYQMGLFGALTLFYFCYNFYAEAKRRLKPIGSTTIKNLAPLFVVLICNLSLDSYVMDFFPTHLFLLVLSILYRNNSEGI